MLILGRHGNPRMPSGARHKSNNKTTDPTTIIATANLNTTFTREFTTATTTRHIPLDNGIVSGVGPGEPMALSKSLAFPSPDRANGHYHANLCGQAPSPTDTAYPNQIVCGSMKDWGSLACTGTIDAAPLPGPWSTGMAHLAHGDNANPPDHEAQLAPSRVVRLHAKIPVEPCQYIAHSAGRSLGDAAPLATILEQGSASTLDRHGSLLYVDPYSSLCAAGSRSYDMLQQQTWRSKRGTLPGDKQFSCDQQFTRHGYLESSRGGIVPVHLVPAVEEDLGVSPALADELRSKRKRLQGLLRNVKAHIRGGTDVDFPSLPSRECNVPRRCGLTLRSSASKNTALARAIHGETEDSEAPELRSCGTAPITSVQPNSFLRAQGPDPSTGECPKTPPSSSACVSSVGPFLLETRTHTPSAIRQKSCPGGFPEDDHSLLNYPLILPYAHQQKTTSVGQNINVHEDAVTRNGGVSLHNQAHGSSRNSSLSATSASTSSYSSSVLGIDLDLLPDLQVDSCPEEHEIPQRSVTPVCFRDQDDATLDRDHPPSDRDRSLPDRGNIESNVHTQEAKRSFTSSALASLLSIAVAEGIVRQSFETPHVSFYSPSGKLIQAHARASTPTPTLCSRPRPAPYFSGTSADPLLHQDFISLSLAEVALLRVGAVTLPPARFAPVRPTTAPLPKHSRHRHNARAVDISRSSIDSEPNTHIPVGSTVDLVSRSRGCIGVFRPIRHKLWGVPDLPSQPVGEGSLKKGPPYIRPCTFPGDTSESPLRTVWSRAVPQKDKRLMKRPPRRKELFRPANAVASLDASLVAAHALRVCFCQPYDECDTGLGRVRCNSIKITGSESCRADTRQREALDKSTPNARIIPRDCAQHGTARRDSAISVGI